MLLKWLLSLGCCERSIALIDFSDLSSLYKCGIAPERNMAGLQERRMAGRQWDNNTACSECELNLQNFPEAANLDISPGSAAVTDDKAGEIHPLDCRVQGDDTIASHPASCDCCT